MDTLIMIPGLGSDAAVWQRTIAALGADVSCVVGDTLTDGSDDGGDSATLAGMGRRILDGAPERFALAGLSMGGMVALEIMRLAPERVTRLALLDTRARPNGTGEKMMRRLTNLVVSALGFPRGSIERTARSLVHPASPDDVHRALVEMSLRVGARAYVRQNRAVIARGDLRPILPTVTVPTMVVVGEDDTLTPPEHAREIHALVRGSGLQVIPRCGHLPPMEKPAETAALLRGWLGAGP